MSMYRKIGKKKQRNTLAEAKANKYKCIGYSVTLTHNSITYESNHYTYNFQCFLVHSKF